MWKMLRKYQCCVKVIPHICKNNQLSVSLIWRHLVNMKVNLNNTVKLKFDFSTRNWELSSGVTSIEKGILKPVRGSFQNFRRASTSANLHTKLVTFSRKQIISHNHTNYVGYEDFFSLTFVRAEFNIVSILLITTFFYFSRWSDCIECPNTGWLLPFVLTVVIALCILVIWLNPMISSELRGPLFFVQVVPYIFNPTCYLGGPVFFIAQLFNFGSPLIYFSKTCILKGLNNLHAATFGYAMPVLALSIFLLAYVLSANYCLKFNFRRNSMLRSFWLLLVFIYSYFVETSLLILFCPKVGDKYVFFYDGEIECFRHGGQHLPIAVIAILVLVFLVIPPPIMVILLTNGCWKVDPQYSSTLRSGLRPECCWWWSVDLCRRVLLVTTYVAVSDLKQKTVRQSKSAGTGCLTERVKPANLKLRMQMNPMNRTKQ